MGVAGRQLIIFAVGDNTPGYGKQQGVATHTNYSCLEEG